MLHPVLELHELDLEPLHLLLVDLLVEPRLVSVRERRGGERGGRSLRPLTFFALLLGLLARGALLGRLLVLRETLALVAHDKASVEKNRTDEARSERASRGAGFL